MFEFAKGGTPFLKMHGLGNDFVVLDARTRPIELSAAAVRAIADRHTGVGCDQLVVLRRPAEAGADAFMEIRNADGAAVGACGNATRCVAALLMQQSDAETVTIATVAGLLEAHREPDGTISVDMGPARLGWHEIPVARDVDTLHLPVALGPLTDPVGTNIGNPHATFFVADVAAVDLSRLGPALEHDPLFPERANIGIAQILSPERIRLRVWERGSGITRACGSGACAALVAAVRRGLTGRRAEVLLDGGSLAIEWQETGHVRMTGPVATSFAGVLHPALLPA